MGQNKHWRQGVMCLVLAILVNVSTGCGDGTRLDTQGTSLAQTEASAVDETPKESGASAASRSAASNGSGTAATGTVRQSSNPVAAENGFYVTSQDKKADAVKDYSGHDREILQRIASQGTAIWLGDEDWALPVLEQSLHDAERKKQIPIFEIQNANGSGCETYSAKYPDGIKKYHTWIDKVAATVGKHRAIMLIEMDALPSGLDCKNSAALKERTGLLNYATRKLAAQPKAVVYVHAGTSTWHTPAEMAPLLRQSGVAAARGFIVNGGAPYDTTDGEKWGLEMSKILGGKHFLVDTARGVTKPVNVWCEQKNRAIGDLPTTKTRSPLIDAYVWTMVPGKAISSDCSPGAPASGTFWPAYALAMAKASGW